MSTLKIGALDMMRTDSRIISALGPVQVGRPDDITEAVRALAVCGGPGTRFGLMPTTESRFWRYDPDAFLDEVVRLPSCTAEGLPALLTERARTSSRSAAISIAVAGDYLIVDLCHGLGDARLVNMLNQVLGEKLTPDRFPDWARGYPTRNPLGTAMARFYTAQPRRVAALLRSRAGAAEAQKSGGELVPWRRAPVVVAARSENGTVNRLRRWRDRTSADLSIVSIVCASIAGEIRSRGIELHHGVNMIYDCRRYLPTHSRVYGNFVSGVDLAVADPGDPVQLNGAITAAAACGRPLAALLLSAQRFHHQYRQGRAHVAAQSVPRNPRATLAFSDIGQAFAGSGMWTGDESERFYNAINEPKGPEAILFTITHRGPDMDVTASFHANVFPPDVIQSALNSVVTEPERTLMRGARD
jgi:hypothetical protein